MARKRRSMSYGKSRRDFRRKSGVHPRNTSAFSGTRRGGGRA